MSLLNLDINKAKKMEDGTLAKPMYIKNLSMNDWHLIKRLMEKLNTGSVTEVIRFAIRKASERI